MGAVKNPRSVDSDGFPLQKPPDPSVRADSSPDKNCVQAFPEKRFHGFTILPRGKKCNFMATFTEVFPAWYTADMNSGAMHIQNCFAAAHGSCRTR